jgi:hypothetical protein
MLGLKFSSSLKICSAFFLVQLVLSPLSLLADDDVLFEGYSKITSGGVPVGYIITRYEFRAKDRRFYSTYFLKTGQLGSDITESLRAVAGKNLEPISYEYTSIVGKETKIIDAKFAKRKMTAIVKTSTEKGPVKVVTIRDDLPKGAFLSTFLVYLMLKSDKGIQTESKYKYTAIAEEDAKILNGEALVGKQEKYNGFQTFKIFNRFKDARFVSYVTDRGEILATSSPATGIATELMAKPSDATGTFPISGAILKSLFGNTPLGTNNAVSKKLKLESMPPPPPPSNPKQQGIPQNQGIILKAQPNIPGTPVKSEEKAEEKAEGKSK